MTPADPATACLKRTRSAVLNVLVGVGLSIAIGGFVLGPRERGATTWPRESARRWFLGALMGTVVASFVTRRVGGLRSLLRDPASRARRFYWSHVSAAAFGLLAVLHGFVYGYAVEPRLEAVAPYWVAGLALGFLALPRAGELDGFDEPMPLTPAKPTA